jgi:hypothetical protein
LNANHRLWKQLMHMGRAAGRRSESGGIRFAALTIAAFLLPLALVTPVGIDATYDGRIERVNSSSFVVAGSDTPTEETLLVLGELDTLNNSRQYEVYYLTPLGPGAPLPPGLENWPDPGEVYLSPRLAELGADQLIEDRYGTFAGTLDHSALVDPMHLVAYVVPSEPLRLEPDGSVFAIADFNGDRDSEGKLFWVTMAHDFPAMGMLAIAVMLFAFPAAILAFSASRVASHARDRRDALIRVLGGRPHHHVLIAIGESWIPIVTGTLAAAAVIAWSSSRNIRLPYVEFTLVAADLRPNWPMFAAALMVAFIALMSMSVFIGMPALQGREPSGPSSSRRSRLLRVLAGCFPVSLILASWVANIMPLDGGLAYLVNYIGQAGIVVTLPAAVAQFTAWTGSVLSKRKMLRMRPALVTANARLAAYPKATARQIAGISAAFILIFIALAHQVSFSSGSISDRQYSAPIAQNIASVRPNLEQWSSIDAYLELVPQDLVVLAYTLEYRGQTAYLTLAGGCEDLTQFRFSCPINGFEPLEGDWPDDRLALWFDLNSGGDVKAAIGDVPPEQFVAAAEPESRRYLLIATEDGSDLPIAELKASAAVLPWGAEVWTEGASETSPFEEHARWIAMFGVIALVVLALTAGFGSAGEFLRHGRALAPIGVLTGGLQTFRAASAVMVFGPLVLGSAGGIAVGLAASDVLLVRGQTLLRADVLVPTLSALLIVAVLMWWWASSVAIREAGRWRPGRGD